MSTGKADLIVIGAGFAGLACAQAASARGLRTIVLDRKADPGAYPHTTGLLVKEVADEWDVPRRLTRKIHGVRLYAPNLRCIDLTSPGYYFLATDTPELLRWWAKQATDCGAVIRPRSPYRGAIVDDSHVHLRGYDLSGRFIVGADGARSVVASDFNLSRNRAFLIGVEAEFENVRGVNEDRLHVFLDSQLAPGYIGWVVPGVGFTQVGLAARRPHAPQLNAFIEKIGGLFDFSGARQVGSRAGRIPVGGPVRRMGSGRALLIGDAAGLVSPLTAGGIHTAIHFGRRAGLAICDYLQDGGFDPVRTIRSELPLFGWKRLMRFAFDQRPPNWMYDLALGSAALASIAQVIFYHHRGLFSPTVWRDVVLGLR